MIKKILSWFNYEPTSVSRGLSNENKELHRKLLQLRTDLALEKNKSPLKEKPFINVNTKDPAPTEEEARKMYVAKVAQYHKEILGPKILAMIGDVRAQLEKFDSATDNSGRPITSFKSEDFDLILKGTVNALWLMYEWGEQMTNEQLSYQEVLSQEEKQSLQALNKN